MQSQPEIPAVGQEVARAQKVQKVSPTLQYALRENVHPKPIPPMGDVLRPAKMWEVLLKRNITHLGGKPYVPAKLEPDPELVEFNRRSGPAIEANKLGRSQESEAILEQSSSPTGNPEDLVIGEQAVRDLLARRETVREQVQHLQHSYKEQFGIDIRDIYSKIVRGNTTLNTVPLEQLHEVYRYAELVGRKDAMELMVTELIDGDPSNLVPDLQHILNQERQRVIDASTHFEDASIAIAQAVSTQLIQEGNLTDPGGWTIKGFDKEDYPSAEEIHAKALGHEYLSDSFELEFSLHGPTFSDYNNGGMTLHDRNPSTVVSWSAKQEGDEIISTTGEVGENYSVSRTDKLVGEDIQRGNSKLEFRQYYGLPTVDAPRPMEQLKHAKSVLHRANNRMDGILSGKYHSLVVGVSHGAPISEGSSFVGTDRFIKPFIFQTGSNLPQISR